MPASSASAPTATMPASSASAPTATMPASTHNRGAKRPATRSGSAQRGTVSHEDFYGEYHGHRPEHLELVSEALRPRPVLWLCGDSTLDNKFWLDFQNVPAVNGFEAVLRPPRMQPDVAYHLNAELHARGVDACAINCSVEESTLGGRSGGLLAQDAFLRDHLRPEDAIVLSVGGNDIALRPTLKTVACMAALLASPVSLIESGWAPGLSHFVRLFRDDTRALLQRLTEKQAPAAIVVCMLYYLDESAESPSWASRTLSILGYNANPAKLQLLMRIIYERATCEVGPIPGTTVLPLPLYAALDGKDPNDYVQRVEPSGQGGRKMAVAVLDRLRGVWPLATAALGATREGRGSGGSS